jgi:XTP/dITP diphosphohydrolase
MANDAVGRPPLITFASGNAHKVRELQALANASRRPVTIVPAPVMPVVLEDAGTFTGNARKKAAAVAAILPAGAWVLADDSGLCVDALGGAPGVESAYFAGLPGDGAANLRKLVEVMRAVPDGRRDAHFECVLLLHCPGHGVEQVFAGRCPGVLRHTPAGGSGFGYDPLFVPAGWTQTFAELGDEVKNSISHRARAFAQLVAWLSTDAAPQTA